MDTRNTNRIWLRISGTRITPCVLAMLVVACSTDDGESNGEASASAVALLTRVCGPDTCQSFLSTYESLEAMKAARAVDKSKGVEVPYSQGRVHDGSIYLFNRDEPTVTRWTVEEDLSLTQHETLSFANTGTTVFCQICNVFAGPELAFHVDAIAGGVVVAWNPKTMELIETTDVPESIMSRGEGLTPEVIFPDVIDGRAFYNASWTDWDGLVQLDRAALVTFETNSPSPTLRVLEDDRCGGTYAMTPFADAAGNVYAMGDWQGGYFDVGILASRPPACLLRVQPGANEFDPDFYVNLLEVAQAKAIRNAFPMAGGRILLNILPKDAPGVMQEEFNADPWAYYELTGFTYVVLDVETLEVTPVQDLAPAGAGNSTPLAMDGRNFIQVYPEGRDFGAHLYEVSADGEIAKIIEAGSAGDFSMIGRVR